MLFAEREEKAKKSRHKEDTFIMRVTEDKQKDLNMLPGRRKRGKAKRSSYKEDTFIMSVTEERARRPEHDRERSSTPLYQLATSNGSIRKEGDTFDSTAL